MILDQVSFASCVILHVKPVKLQVIIVYPANYNILEQESYLTVDVFKVILMFIYKQMTLSARNAITVV